jgi:putative endonuclease
MYYVYILYSRKSSSYYIGQTKNIHERLKRHNRGDSRSTKAGRPWEILLVEQFLSRRDACQRERYLKSPQGWQELRILKSRPKVGCPPHPWRILMNIAG